MGCYTRERLQWLLASHGRVWEGVAEKVRRQKMKIFPTDMGIEAALLVFVTVLLELQIAELSPGWGRRCVWTSWV